MEDLDKIPFRWVNHSAWVDLANKMDPELVLGNGWKTLAEKLGYSMELILNIEARHTSHGRNTFKLFEDYMKRNGSSVGAVMKALKEMEREDAVEALEKHLPDIHKAYLQDRRTSEESLYSRHPVENSCYEHSRHCESLGYTHRFQRQSSCTPCVSMYTPVHSKSPYHGNMSPRMSPPYNDLSRNGDTIISCSSNRTKNYNFTSSSYTNNTGNTRTTDSLSTQGAPDSASKIVHIDPSEHYTSEDIEMAESYSPHDNPTPIAAAIQRDQNYRNMNIKRSLNKTPVEDGESPPIHAKRPDLRLNIQPGMRHHDMISPSPSPAVGQEMPLAQLNHFAKSNVFKPSSEFSSLMQEKNAHEFEQVRRAHGKDPHLKLHLPSKHPNGMLDFHTKSAPTDGCRKVEVEFPRTFPLRNKEFVGYQTSLPPKDRPSLLKFSQSVPNDMKPAEYRKAFKHIKVFVTYAGDSKKHIQKVLNLCRCLEKNGFSCCMDMFDKRMPQEEIQLRQDWCAQRFYESDFILMCASPQYKTEVDVYEYEEIIDDKELHIQFIYSLMLEELKQNRNTKVIPLLFEGANEEHIPDWLKTSFIYKWPVQYRDLLWCLTKPHTRIKPVQKLNHSQSVPSTPVAASPAS